MLLKYNRKLIERNFDAYPTRPLPYVHPCTPGHPHVCKLHTAQSAHVPTCTRSTIWVSTPASVVVAAETKRSNRPATPAPTQPQLQLQLQLQLQSHPQPSSQSTTPPSPCKPAHQPAQRVRCVLVQEKYVSDLRGAIRPIFFTAFQKTHFSQHVKRNKNILILQAPPVDKLRWPVGAPALPRRFQNQ